MTVANLWRRWKIFFQRLPLIFSQKLFETAPTPGLDSGITSKPAREMRKEHFESRHEIMYLSNKTDASSLTRQNMPPTKPVEPSMKRYHLLSPQ